MALITRRSFARQTALAAAFCAPPLGALAASYEFFGSNQQTNAPLDPEGIAKLASRITGRVITPQSPGYDAVRSIFNLAFDRHPAVIVQCANPSDVARTLEFAQAKRQALAVRAGGHSRLGFGICDGGVVIDLSAMKQVEVDVHKRVALAQAGALVRDLDQATQRFGLATTSGGCPTVGIAGLTLGGGEGHLMSRFGAACDNLLSAQVVTVDGSLLQASQNSNSDLFWAIRGGGGNFGVVTSLEYQLHPVGSVLSGALTYPAGRIEERVRAFAKFIEAAPDEMDALAQLLPSQEGPRLKIDVFDSGDPQTGSDLLKPLRALKPAEDSVKVTSYVEAQAGSGFLAAPVAHFQTNLFLTKLTDDAIAVIATAGNNAPKTCKLIMVTLRGAISRVAPADTAFALRQPGYEIDIAGVWSTSAERANVVRWVQTTRDNLQPFAHGVYVNQAGDTSSELVRAAYGPNYARLVSLKKKYDPNNVLRLNQNIAPV